VERKTLAMMMILAVAGRGSAWAQDTAAIKQALSRVPAGTAISVLDTSGQTNTGRLSDATDTVITLDGSRNVAANRIARITVKDSTRNGAKIGALIGGTAGLVGALAVGAVYANEGSGAGAASLLLIGLGTGAGAGIGWLGDSLKQQEIYRVDATPRRLSPEVRARVARSDRAGGVPEYGLAWSMAIGSGFGVEANVDHTIGASDGEGRGFSVDGRALYAFGPRRAQPYVSGGIGFVRHDRHVTIEVPPSEAVPGGLIFSGNQPLEGVAPVFGAGLRLQPARHLVIRPEVSWFIETAPNSSERSAVARAGVSIGAAW
jgi:hypothetical protein